jgi:Uma2 family endonuclease
LWCRAIGRGHGFEKIEWIANGVLLGWLIDPMERRVYIYRPGQPVEILEHPEVLRADPELPGFTLELAPIWAAA